jgi:cytochrome P450
LTFSAGGRSCLGKQLALSELKIIVIQIFRKYEMTMSTNDLIMKMHNFSYQPQNFTTKFVKKGEFVL